MFGSLGAPELLILGVLFGGPAVGLAIALVMMASRKKAGYVPPPPPPPRPPSAS